MVKTPNFRKSSANHKNIALVQPFYSPSEAASILGKSEDTISRWCKSGKLGAIPKRYGTKTTFEIPKQTLALQLEQLSNKDAIKQRQTKKPIDSNVSKLNVKPLAYLSVFQRYCLQGLITGRAFSSKTVDIYTFYLEPFLLKYQGQVNPETLEKELLEIPVDKFCKRLKLYEAIVCYTKFLVKEGLACKSVIEEYKALRPKRHRPPRRNVVNEDELELLEAACQTLSQRLLLKLLFTTGLRASEFCNLKREDLRLEKRELIVRLAKGGKTRTVGLREDVKELLESYLKLNPKKPDDYVFHNRLGKQMSRYGLRDRLKRLGKKAGCHVHPHALRRAFVTVNANKGRSLVHLQLACGHSDIQTTRSYCRTTEQEVINAMKDW